MVIDEIKKIKSDKSELRKFGITMAIALALLGGLFLWRGKEYYNFLFFSSFVLLFLGLIAPIMLWPVHKVWMTFALLMGWVMTRVILSIFYFVIFTPLALVFKLFGKSFLELKIDKPQESYWNYREIKQVEKVEYERQF